MEVAYILGWFDGASKGNPGFAGAGAHIGLIYTGDPITTNPHETWCAHRALGACQTNNVAEYVGLKMLLKRVCVGVERNEWGKKVLKIILRGDSNLVIGQVSGKMRCNAPHLQRLRDECAALLQRVRTRLEPHGTAVELSHVFRSENKRADVLANIGAHKARRAAALGAQPPRPRAGTGRATGQV